MPIDLFYICRDCGVLFRKEGSILSTNECPHCGGEIVGVDQLPDEPSIELASEAESILKGKQNKIFEDQEVGRFYEPSFKPYIPLKPRKKVPKWVYFIILLLVIPILVIAYFSFDFLNFELNSLKRQGKLVAEYLNIADFYSIYVLTTDNFRKEFDYEEDVLPNLPDKMDFETKLESTKIIDGKGITTLLADITKYTFDPHLGLSNPQPKIRRSINLVWKQEDGSWRLTNPEEILPDYHSSDSHGEITSLMELIPETSKSSWNEAPNNAAIPEFDKIKGKQKIPDTSPQIDSHKNTYYPQVPYEYEPNEYQNPSFYDIPDVTFYNMDYYEKSPENQVDPDKQPPISSRGDKRSATRGKK